MFYLAIDELCFLNFLCKWNHIRTHLVILGLASFTWTFLLWYLLWTSSLPLLGCAHCVGNITCLSVG